VWLVATIGVPLQFLTGDEWMQISMIYIGSQAATSFMLEYAKIKKGGQQV
jgi:energy-converting hydrogenase Eha subunit E